MWRLRQGLARPASRTHFRSQLRVRAFVVDAGAAPPASPTSAELLRDSKLAALSGLAYVPPADLAAQLQHHGLELQAHGNTYFTRWFVACPSPAAAAAAAASRTAAARAAAGNCSAPVAGDAAAAAGAGGSMGAADPDQQYIFLRGISWRSADLDALRVWQGLIHALPSFFLPHLTSPTELLMAHSGLSEMAEELYGVLRPHMEGHSRLHLAGHSLGGSLATLVALTAHLRLGGSSLSSASISGAEYRQYSISISRPSSDASEQQQEQRRRWQQQRLQVRCTTFGSPPVVALVRGAGEDGRSILQAVGLPLGSVRNYVLQGDPVPRALLGVDSAFQALQQSPMVAGLLRLRKQWLGQGSLSPTRFLFHPVGDVYLIRWSAEAGHSVRLLAPHTLQDELKLDVEALRASPLAMMQALMDHHHGSYSAELRVAAAALTKQEGAAAPRPPAQAGPSSGAPASGK